MAIVKARRRTSVPQAKNVMLRAMREILDPSPIQRGVAEGDLPVMSIAALRSGSTAKHFATRDDLADLRLDIARPADVLVAIEGGTIGETMVVPDSHDDHHRC